MKPTSLSEKVKARFDHETTKRVLQERYHAKMFFAHNGGMWKAGPDLITQCNLCLANKHFQPVLLDTYNNPVSINAEELKTLALERWQEQMNAWHVEYQELTSKR
jgi:hypothetical protein